MSVFSIMTEFKAYDSVTPVFKKMTSSAGTFQDRVQQMSRSINNSMSIVRQGFSNIRTGIGSFTDKIFNVKNALMALTAGGAIQAITSLSKQWIDFASDLTETQGKIDVVFENSADSLRKWASTSIQTMGLAKQTALDSAALYGDMGVGMGLTRAQAAEMAMTLTRLGADMASFKNISNDMAQTALKSVYTGETESLKNLGIVMTEANLAEYARSIGLKKKIRPVNRLDKNTSGLVVFAKNEYIQECLVKQMKNNLFYKEYIAVCEGKFEKNKDVINAPIARKEESIIERCIDKNGDVAITEYKVLKYNETKNYSIVKCILKTGRTHQIRVHLSYIGHPILGDTLYGNSSCLINRQALHAYKISFLHPITKQNVQYTSSLPSNINKLVENKLY